MPRLYLVYPTMANKVLPSSGHRDDTVAKDREKRRRDQVRGGAGVALVAHSAEPVVQSRQSRRVFAIINRFACKSRGFARFGFASLSGDQAVGVVRHKF